MFAALIFNRVSPTFGIIATADKRLCDSHRRKMNKFYCLIILASIFRTNGMRLDIQNEVGDSSNPKLVSGHSKTKALADLFRKKMQKLKSHDEIELVILVDGSSSIGPKNFLTEMKYIQKLISDVEVSPDAFRLGVIIYSSKAVIHVDHLSMTDPLDVEKCSLLNFDLPNVVYPGLNTNTKAALEKAEKILTRARSRALKVVFLITDGFSNMGDPLPVAEILKDQNVIIYTFGIENGNVKELRRIASEPFEEHAYLFDSFDEFEGFARRALHEDLNPGKYAPAKNSTFCNNLCPNLKEDPGGNACCSDDATCTCGLISGHFSCLCPPGYYGSGLVGEGCTLCPEGTFSEGLFPGGALTCAPCPDVHHTTTKYPATSKAFCVCKDGTIRDGDKCAIISCPRLSPPKNGYFVKKNCSNVINAACGVRCHMGHVLTGSSVRICQRNGTWSGVEPVCKPKTCHPPKTAPGLVMTCTSDDNPFKMTAIYDRNGKKIEDDDVWKAEKELERNLTESNLTVNRSNNWKYTVGTECAYSCSSGHSLIGSKSRGCLPMLKWSGLKPTCRSIKCPSLPEMISGNVEPKNCTLKGIKHPFGEVCRFICNPGYELRGPNMTNCTGKHGSWSEKHSPSKCVDVEPPKIDCPGNFTTKTDEGVHFATVKFALPKTTDNSNKEPIIWSKPPFEDDYPLRFIIGLTQIEIYSVDEAGNYALCSFMVEVKDEEKPLVLECRSPPTFFVSEFPPSFRGISWKEPVFDDNSGIPISIVRAPVTSDFPKGTTSVTYTATDAAGNEASCTLNITILDDPCREIPKESGNTLWNCTTDWNEMTTCLVSCPEGFDLVTDTFHHFGDEGIALNCTFFGRKAFWTPDIFWGDVDLFPECSAVVEPEEVKNEISIEDGSESCNDLNSLLNDLVYEIVSEGENVTVSTFCEEEEAEEEEEEDEEEDESSDEGNEWEEVEKETIQSEKDRHGGEQKNEEILGNSSENTPEMVTGGVERENSKNENELKFDDEKRTEKTKSNEGENQLGNPKETTSGVQNTSPKEEENESNGSVRKKRLAKRRKRLRVSFTVKGGKRGDKQNRGTAKHSMEATVRFVKKLNVGEEESKLSDSVGKIKTIFSCPKGSLPKRNACVKCPKGTFHNLSRSKCDPCPVGQYQETEGEIECIRCPEGHSTRKIRRKHSKQCKRICPAGTFGEKSSEMGLALAPCTPCPIGFYQFLDGQTSCERCSNNFTTLRRGTVDSDSCVAPSELKDPCFKFSCRNGGICFVNDGFAFCHCQPGFAGSFCEKKFDPCGSVSCYNGGQCHPVGSVDYECRCPAGFEGNHCEKEANECSSNPCSGHGECTDLLNGYQCDCFPGFKGSNCNETIGYCEELTPCMNSGVCVETNGSYACLCKEGFFGDHCEVVYDCHLDDCAIEAGTNSSELIDPCANFSCSKNEKCQTQKNGRPLCVCSGGFRGINCLEEINPKVVLNFPKYGVTEYLIANFPEKDLVEISVGVWIKTKDSFNYGTIFSYATLEEDNSFTLTDYSGVVLYASGHYVVTDLEANDGLWHFICVTWQSYEGRWQVYLDGVIFSNGTGLSNGTVIPGGGILVVGQEQDTFGGGFNDVESFAGRLTYFQIWDRVLRVSEVKDLYGKCEDIFGNLISWPQLLQGVNGDIVEEESAFCKTCTSNLDLYRGKIEYELTDRGKVARYTCDEGFLIKFDSHRDAEELGNVNFYIRKCMKFGDWETKEPKCGRISCGFPGFFFRGKIFGSSYQYGDAITYRCEHGYWMEGNDTRICMSNGTWSGEAPLCRGMSTECEKPTAPRHGSMFVYFKENKPYGSSPMSTGDRVEFTCDRGYVLKGFGVLTCVEEGTWDREAPTCEKIECQFPIEISRFIPPHIHRNATFHFGDVVTLICPSGERPNIFCGSLGSWNLSRNICGNACTRRPNNIENGFVADENLKPPFYEGERLRVRCLPGFRRRGDRSIMCSSNGTWIQSRPTVCHQSTCGPPPPPPSAYRIVHEEGHNRGDKIFLRCSPGYQSSGEISIRCEANGRYSRIQNHCTIISCGKPLLPEGYSTKTFDSSYSYGRRILIECPAGKSFVRESQAFIECLSDGRWSSPPECF